MTAASCLLRLLCSAAPATAPSAAAASASAACSAAAAASAATAAAARSCAPSHLLSSPGALPPSTARFLTSQAARQPAAAALHQGPAVLRPALVPRPLLGGAAAGGRSPWQRLLASSTAAEAEAAMREKARRIALPVGAAAGAFGGLVGVGGGVLIAPVIVNACKTIPQRVVAGTSLAAVAATGAVAGSVYWGGGAVDLQAAGYVTATALLAAPLGALATTKLNCQLLRKLLGYWLYLVAPLVPLKVWLLTDTAPQAAATPDATAAPATGTQPSTNAAASPPPSAPAATGAPAAAGAAAAAAVAADPVEAAGAADRHGGSTALLLLATGAVAGLASGLLGIGGGTIVTPLLAISTDMSHTEVLGTSLAAMLLPSLVGLTKHHRLGNVDWPMAARLAAGTAAGGWVGSKLALQAPPGALELVFAGSMLLLGNRTLAGVRAAAAAAKKAAAAAAGKP